MYLVYSKADEFCASTFSGDINIALENGYKEVSDEMYEKLLNREAHWVNEELVERVKPQEEIDAEKERARIEAIKREIQQLKKFLSDSDYQAIKHSEGWISDEEYAAIKAQRQVWRDRINELENSI